VRRLSAKLDRKVAVILGAKKPLEIAHLLRWRIPNVSGIVFVVPEQGDMKGLLNDVDQVEEDNSVMGIIHAPPVLLPSILGRQSAGLIYAWIDERSSGVSDPHRDKLQAW